MSGRAVACRRPTISRPQHDHSRGLDFYLPPPDDRAYRWDKIQRLRNMSTAWKQNRRSQSQTDKMRWSAASCCSLSSRKHAQRRFGKSPQDCGRTKTEECSGDVHSRSRLPPETDTPYYHDNIVFFLPADKSSELDKTQRSFMCYSVTTNKRETARLEGSQVSTCLPALSSRGMTKGNNSSHLLTSGWSTLSQENAAQSDALQAAKLRSVDLVSSVHKEFVRRRSLTNSLPSTASAQMPLTQTMEVPIDWEEYTRQSGDGVHCAAGRNVSPYFNPSLLSRPVTQPSAAVPHEVAGRPATSPLFESKKQMRLYVIRMERIVTNSMGNMEPRSDAPKMGDRVVLSGS
ncbi:hypothetical protein ERJ75_000257600 [Trypanosoma vivax]|uniref:Uncharacterized protein n=1 Tax=Trypanosoma vivax (strain Y486) TaxID=1055687 RepID=F9WP17_TRYVY|nr:hypothetical protein ERJ75_000257600 [Trypanosoma vivax]CCD19290.1 hypothetical protein, conserved [Trypanosoma vivax Y486]|eukprot:CCD19290.1 hypothetical protein, conserved [Trypanosoma vivax Y486]